MLLDIEQKLDLIQQIHREQEKNERYYRKESEGQVSWSASFRLRLLLAVLLFLCFFVMEKKQVEVGGICSSDIVDYIGSNMDIEKLSTLVEY